MSNWTRLSAAALLALTVAAVPAAAGEAAGKDSMANDSMAKDHMARDRMGSASTHTNTTAKTDAMGKTGSMEKNTMGRTDAPKR